MKIATVQCKVCAITYKTKSPTIPYICSSCSTLTRFAQRNLQKKLGLQKKSTISVPMGLGKTEAGKKARLDQMIQKVNLRDALVENGFTQLTQIQTECNFYKELDNQFYIVRIDSGKVYHGLIELRHKKSKEHLLQGKKAILRAEIKGLTGYILLKNAVLMDGIIMDFSLGQ